jgi:NADPH:quinone reductase-like Zn-dependent oxidoreductase
VRSYAADLDFESPAACVDHLIDHRTVDFEARARQITGELAVELILDSIGGDSLTMPVSAHPAPLAADARH